MSILFSEMYKKTHR